MRSIGIPAGLLSEDAVERVRHRVVDDRHVRRIRHLNARAADPPGAVATEVTRILDVITANHALVPDLEPDAGIAVIQHLVGLDGHLRLAAIEPDSEEGAVMDVVVPQRDSSALEQFDVRGLAHVVLEGVGRVGVYVVSLDERVDRAISGDPDPPVVMNGVGAEPPSAADPDSVRARCAVAVVIDLVALDDPAVAAVSFDGSAGIRRNVARDAEAPDGDAVGFTGNNGLCGGLLAVEDGTWFAGERHPILGIDGLPRMHAFSDQKRGA